MVNVMCQLNGTKGYLIADKTLFLGMSLRVLAFDSVD